MGKVRRFVTLAVFSVLFVLGSAVAAFATPPTPAEEVTTLLGSAVPDLILVVVALYTGLITLAVTMWGIRKAFRAIKSGGRA
jgi:hypothetical protein